METQPEYIQVLTPLKLEKALTYRVPAPLQGRTGPGTRVKVRVGGRLTDAVVTRSGVVPDIAPERIRDHPLAVRDGFSFTLPAHSAARLCLERTD